MVDFTCTTHFFNECTHESCVVRTGGWTEEDFQSEVEDQDLDPDCTKVSFFCIFMKKETIVMKGETPNCISIW